MWGMMHLLALTNISSHKGEQIFTLTSLCCSQNNTVYSKTWFITGNCKGVKHLFVGLSSVGCDPMFSLSLQVLALLVIKSGGCGALQI